MVSPGLLNDMFSLCSFATLNTMFFCIYQDAQAIIPTTQDRGTRLHDSFYLGTTRTFWKMVFRKPFSNTSKECRNHQIESQRQFFHSTTLNYKYTEIIPDLHRSVESLLNINVNT
jgi:hypothetical protein